VALVRVYCGLASTQSVVARGSSGAWLTVAVVDDAGRLMDVCDLSDDPSGYAQLGTLLAERSGGGTAGVAVAADSDEHQVTLLLAAAGRPLAIVEEDSLDDYAERFGDDESADELDAPVSERRAIGLARALQAGALAAATQSAPRELMALKPVLAAHAALAAGRQGAAVALREVLRELYPAALRAYPDPAEAIPLAILDALPEPGLLGGTTATRGRDAAVAADLAARGLADHETISEAITALRVAIAETPRRAGIGKTLTTAVAETIQQAVAAVAACDNGIAALVGLLAEKATPVAAPGRRPGAAAPLRAIREPSADAPTRIPNQRRGRPQPAPVVVDPLRGPSMAGPTVPAPPTTQPGLARRPEHAAASHAQPEQINPPLGHSGAFPVASAPPVPVPSAPPASAPPSFVGNVADPYPSGQSYSYPSAYATGAHPTVVPSPEVGPPGSRSDWPLNTTGTGAGAAAEPAVTGNSGGYPVTSLPPTVLERRQADPPPVPRQRDGRVPPPWQADDLPAEPPSLRLVEPGPLADPALRDDQRSRSGDRDYLGGLDRSGDNGRTDFGRGDNGRTDFGRADLGGRSDLGRGDPGRGDPGRGDPGRADLGRVDVGGRGEPGRSGPDRGTLGAAAAFGADRRPGGVAAAFPREPVAEPNPPLRLVEPNGRPGDPISAPPVGDEGDGDLLIFAQARSAWFTGHLDQADAAPDWANPADLGWQAAERASSPILGDETSVGLPRRVPQANLVPGSPLPPVSDLSSLRIVRDPAAMAAHTTGYFRGSRRGEEVRGFAVGGRPGREAAGGWDFSRDGWEADRDERDYGYRSASNR
jgi:hypothetical protein